MKLVAPPLYVLTTQTLDKVKGVEVLTQGEGRGGGRAGSGSGQGREGGRRGMGQDRKRPCKIQEAGMPHVMTWRRAAEDPMLGSWPHRFCCAPPWLLRSDLIISKLCSPLLLCSLRGVPEGHRGGARQADGEGGGARRQRAGRPPAVGEAGGAGGGKRRGGETGD